MPLDDILKRIRSEAEAKERDIIDAAQREASARMDKAASEAERVAKAISESAQRAQNTVDLARARAASQKRQAILKAKQELVTSAFQEAQTRLQALPPDQYRALMFEVLQKTAYGDEEVVVAEEDRVKLGDDFEKAANRALAEAGKPGGLKVVYLQGTLGGGVILRRGKVSSNLTFPAVLAKERDALEIEVAEILFGESTGQSGG